MIKLFRNIRKKLITENQSIIRNTNYLKYAIGEIVLVVIGILIALQINNANEQRKERLKAKVYIEKIIKDLEADTLNLNQLISMGEKTRKNIEAYFKFYEASNARIEVLIDSANNVQTSFTRYLPVNFTFKEMQSSGNTALLNDKQKAGLIELTNQQEFYQIVLQTMISNLFDKKLETQKYQDNGWAKTDFFEKFGIPQDKRTKAQGLFLKHNELQLIFSIAEGYVFLSANIKSKTIEVLKVLKEDSN